MILLYGATGYTGRLVARTFAEQGLQPVLSGRREDALRAVADPLGLDVRIGGLDDLDLSATQALLNCAGPFGRTQAPLLRRCVDAGVAYLDLAGEVDEHLAAAAWNDRARAAGVLVMPGAGYGIVASDCLAAYVAETLVGPPVRVEVALKTVGAVSRGTAEVVLGSLRRTGVRRRSGALVACRPGRARMKVDFGDGDGLTTVVTNPWRADLVASVPATPSYDTYMAFPAPVRMMIGIPHGGLLRAVARRLPEGPTDEALAQGRSAVWARATGTGGAQTTAVLRGPDAYIFTAKAAAACMRRILAGDAPPGVHTPASAWGYDLALEIDGVVRVDV
ncbi:saccharopine dehydrogenase family protein [Mycobacterium paragordonae]|uniref:Saccharopine dehydrogenase NADP-binding domain-containing protein n=1 Tax=Mycobacterium paragordonae TaxID=1389713 RepID=A0AAJ1S7G1_9MYCO|nr:saccharopine dehydrogenase NADP-binding domain-containing protein [Mycobacterium paragordonae]MDP7736194.1 saccharopine dehydrogenase NADP-binding domain-containing protein [Mycobacterium paragordonae]